MKKSELIIFSIITVSFVLAVYFYPQMPEIMASHWNAKGQVNGYLPKFWGLFLMPLITLGLLVLFVVISKIDPLKQNIEKFRKYYNGFVVLIIVFLFYLFLLTIFWNLGARFNMATFLIPALGALFYYLGVLMEKAKRNWFVGIRTPWTLSSEKVWDKTHQQTGKLFKAAGVVALFGVLLSSYVIYIALIPVILIAVYATAYSYFQYQREKK